MKQEFYDYLNVIGVPQIAQAKVEEIYDFYNGLYPDVIEDILIEEYINADSTREYDCILFFSQDLILDVANFLNNPQYHIVNIQALKNSPSITMQINNYKPGEASDQSRLFINILHLNGGFSMKTSKENCDYAWNIFNKYLKY